MGFELVLSFGRPCDLPGLSFELVSVDLRGSIAVRYSSV
jgi:hypothetical protein